MRKKLSLTAFLMMICVIGLVSTCNGQSEHVASFFMDVNREPVPVTIKIDSIKNVFVFGEHLPANGAITKTAQGYEITIDTEFYAYYFTDSQVKRLVYFLLAHEVLGKPKGKGLMNENLMYKRLKRKDIEAIRRNGI